MHKVALHRLTGRVNPDVEEDAAIFYNSGRIGEWMAPSLEQFDALWSRRACGVVLEQEGLQPMAQNRLVQLWADLLEALVHGAPSISTSADEMAGELPRELVRPVNLELRQRGSAFQVRPARRTQPSRRASACLRARSSNSRS